MNILVLIKKVPDLVEELEIDVSGKKLDEYYLRYIISETDDHALEQALLIKEASGGTVTALGINAREIDEALFTALAKGADKAVKITGAFDDGADSHTLSKVFAEAIKGLNYDLILTGTYGIDDLDGQIGPFLAKELNLPYAGVVMGVAPEGGDKVVVLKEYPGGVSAQMTVKLPAVLGIQSASETPRYVAVSKVRQVMKTAKIEEIQASLPSIEKLNIEEYSKAQAAKQAKILEGSSEDIAKKVAEIIKEKIAR